MPYQKHVVEKVLRTSGASLGTQLGKKCVAANMSVMDVAEHFKVSRQCVYNWFFGIHDVDESLQQEVKEYISKL